MNQVFNIKRFSAYCKYKLVLNYKIWFKQLVAYAGIFTIVTGLFFININEQLFNEIYQLLFFMVMVSCVLYITSRSFHELESTSKGFLFMQLPVSKFEKFIVVALGTTIVFPILLALYYVGVAIVSNFFWSIIHGFEPFYFKLFSNTNIIVFKALLMVQPFFMLGSVAFKKQHLLRTAIVFVTVATGLISAWLIVVRIAFGTFHVDKGLLSNVYHITVNGFTLNDLVIIVMILVGWLISWFKLNEKEV